MGLRRGVKALVLKGVQFAGEHLNKKEPKAGDSPSLNARRQVRRDRRSLINTEHGENLPKSTSGTGRASLWIISLGLMLILLVTATSFSKQFTGADSPKCRTIYMYPSYARIDGFDTRYTHLAKKYHLYLYREQGKDREPLADGAIQLDGVPVLFIPGNAGSFKQARSIAAASANMYFDEKDSIENPYTRNLDFFTADFNEDFTAFHGRTMLDQAEYLNDAVRYILSLYESSESLLDPRPQTVLIIGHSMGGVVARVMPTLRNHVPQSVTTYITLSAPHAVAPVTFDGDMLKIYDRITKYWKSQFEDNSSFFSQNVSLISITGGVLDTILPADFTLIEDIVPYTNGFTTYTTTIPQVWTPIDHLAIVWCDQLRQVLAKLLLESINAKSASKSLPLDHRMRLYRKSLISGLEDYAAQDLNVTNISVTELDITIPKKVEEISVDEKFVLTSATELNRKEYAIFRIPKNVDDMQFSLLASGPAPQIYFCDDNSYNLENKNGLDEAAPRCISASSGLKKVPKSSSDSRYPSDSSIGEQEEPFQLLFANKTILSEYETVILKLPSHLPDNEFIVAELSTTKAVCTWNDNPFKVLVKGILNIHRPVNSSLLFSTIRLPQLWSSVISYRIKTRLSGENLLFEPFIRQSIEKPFETKWHVNIRQGPQDLNFHNIAPFVPFNSRFDRSPKLNFISPPGAKIDVVLEVNWWLTLKMLLIRFRLSIAAFTVGFVSLVFSLQFVQYNRSGLFISFDKAIVLLLNKYWKQLFGATSLFIPLSNLLNLTKLWQPSNVSNQTRLWIPYTEHFSSNALFLGVDELFMWWLGPFFLTMTISSVYMLYRLIFVIEMLAELAVARLPSSSQVIDVKFIGIEDSNKRNLNFRQAAITLLLTVSVIVYIPYQFAFIILTIVQAILCIKLAIKGSQKEESDILNFNNTLLLLMLFLVPINAPIVMVFMRNFAIRWETPFRSHHNCLAILPIILLIESNARFRLPLRSPNRNLTSVATVGWLLHISIYSFIFGTRNLYWLHHLFNSLCAILFLKTLA